MFALILNILNLKIWFDWQQKKVTHIIVYTTEPGEMKVTVVCGWSRCHPSFLLPELGLFVRS